MNVLKALPCLFILAVSVSQGGASDDLGENSGYLTGSIVSKGTYPWYAAEGEGPAGSNCIISEYGLAPGTTSIAELSVTGPGILTFQWSVDSAVNDGWLSCELWNGVEKAEMGAITGSGGGWRTVEMFIPQGASKILWTYSKQSGTFEPFLEDSGRVATVTFTATPAAPQTFEAWKTALGIPANASVAPNGLQYYSNWAMGLDPALPVPAGLNTPVKVASETRYRVRYSLAAPVLLTPSFSDDLADWTLRGGRSTMVAGSLTAQTVEFDYFAPVSNRKFFRCSHPPLVTAPAGFAYIPPGTFLMCSPVSEVGRYAYEETFQHQVTLTQGFFIKSHETTYAEWNDTRDWARANGYPDLGYKDIVLEDGAPPVEMGAPGGRFLAKEEGGDITNSAPSLNGEPTQPVTNVNWYETLKWLNARSEREGRNPCYFVRLSDALGGAVVVYRNQTLLDLNPSQTSLICDWNANGYRLPTEAEWEYACRGRTTTALSNGLELTYGNGLGDPLDPNVDPIAWYIANGAASRPVGQKLPNSFGLHDMNGNAAEWCWDLVDTTLSVQFQPTDTIDPKGQSTRGNTRPYRGGSWGNSGRHMRSALREPAPVPTLQAGHRVGFRIARNLD